MRLWNHHYRLFTMCLLGSTLLILPQLQHARPSLLDIAETVSYQNASLHQLHQTIQSDTERFRPIYIAERILLSRLFGYSLTGYFIFHMMLLATTVFVIMQFVPRAHRLILLLITGVLLYNPITIDAYWRLGTAEPILTLAILLTLLGYIKHNTTLFVVTFLLSCLSKETFIWFVPMFLWLVRKKPRLLLPIASISILFFLNLLPRILVSQTNPQTYTAFLMKPDIRIFFTTLRGYIKILPSFMIGVFLLIGYSMYHLRNLRRPDRIILLSLIISLLPVITVRNVQDYYLLPTLSIAIILLLQHITSELNAHRKHEARLMIVVTTVCLALMLPRTSQRGRYWIADYAGDNRLYEWLKDNVSRPYTITMQGRHEYRTGLQHILTHADFLEFEHEVSYACQEALNNSLHPYAFTNTSRCTPDTRLTLPGVLLTEHPTGEKPTIALDTRSWVFPTPITKWYVREQ